MVLQMSPKIPGQLLGDPGPPLNSIQTRALLDQLYRMADRPAVPTSGKRVFKDISETEEATHVYVKVDNPQSLCPKFEGPYRIFSRPSRSTVEVKLGLFSNGELRKQTYHWSACKVAAMRDEAVEADRPKLGRPPKSSTSSFEAEPMPSFLTKSLTTPVMSGSEAVSNATDSQNKKKQPVVVIYRQSRWKFKCWLEIVKTRNKELVVYSRREK